MKKVLIGLSAFVALFMITGCTSNLKLDLDNVKEEVVNLTSDKFSPSGLYELDLKEYFGETEEIYDLESYNTETSKVEYFYGIKSTEGEHFYLVMKPYEENMDEVKEQMNTYMNGLEQAKVLNEEYEGYLVYVYADNTTDVFNKIKTVKERILPSLMEVDVATIGDVLQIEDKWVEEFLMMQPMMMVNSSQFIIIKPASGHEKDVKEKVEEYLTNLEEQWKTYLPAQYDLVVNRKEEKLGNYLIYIISDNNDLIYETIKKNEIK